LNRYTNLGSIFILITLILPIKEVGSLDHFSRDVLVCSKRGVKLSLNNSEIFLETTTPKYVHLSGATANGWGEKEVFFLLCDL